MTNNPPPAPDWVMGDDGHWKPPPFDGGGHRPAAPPAPPTPAPWAGPPPGPPAPRPKGNGLVIGIVIAVVGAVVAIPIILILAVTFLGQSADSKFVAVGSTIDSGDGGLVPIEPNPAAPTNPIGADPALAAWCPTGEAVAATLGDVTGPAAAAQPTTQLDMNGVPLDADLCYYGGTIDLGRIPTSDPGGTVDELLGSTGRYTASDGGLGVPSIRLVLPGGESGAVRLVFVHGDDLLTVAVNGPDDGRADSLAQLLLARPPG